MSTIIENGLTAVGGANAIITSDLIITGAVTWVDSVTGTVSGPGTFEAPYHTLAGAVAVATASNGDIIAIKSGHLETLTAAITLSKVALKIFGLGSGSAAPNFTCDAAIDCIDITAAQVELYNLYFLAGTTTPNNSRINVGAANVKIINCTFLCGVNDLTTITLPDAGDAATISGCTFTVTANGPDSGILVESATTAALSVVGCSFDAANIGFDDAAIHSTVAHVGFIYQNNTLTNGADIIHTGAAKGIASGTIAGDECMVTI